MKLFLIIVMGAILTYASSAYAVEVQVIDKHRPDDGYRAITVVSDQLICTRTGLVPNVQKTAEFVRYYCPDVQEGFMSWEDVREHDADYVLDEPTTPVVPAPTVPDEPSNPTNPDDGSCGNNGRPCGNPGGPSKPDRPCPPRNPHCS